MSDVSDSLQFTVYGIPQGKRSAKPVSFAGHARLYKHPEDVKKSENIATVFQATYPKHKVWHGPVILHIVAWFPIPKSRPNYWREWCKGHLVPHTKKPDEDNIKKLLKDAIGGSLQKLAYHDDSQVFDGRCVKWYCHTEDEMPRLEVWLTHRPDLVPVSPKSKKEKT